MQVHIISTSLKLWRTELLLRPAITWDICSLNYEQHCISQQQQQPIRSLGPASRWGSNRSSRSCNGWFVYINYQPTYLYSYSYCNLEVLAQCNASFLVLSKIIIILTSYWYWLTDCNHFFIVQSFWKHFLVNGCK